MSPSRYDPRKHHRQSLRLKGYDYSRAGAYFVTMCVQHRLCVLGDIVRNAMVLSDCGRIVAQAWTWLRDQYAHVDLDVWVIMPNHLHGIIVISQGASRCALTRRKPLGQLIGAFKTTSTKHINLMRGTPGARFWQRNYYEHIVRNSRDLARIRRYIIANPRRWQADRDNLSNTRQLPLPKQVADYLEEMREQK